MEKDALACPPASLIEAYKDEWQPEDDVQEEEAVATWGYELGEAAKANPSDFMVQATYAHYLADLTSDLRGAVRKCQLCRCYLMQI